MSDDKEPTCDRWIQKGDDDKIEVAMTREQWDDIINLRGVVLGSTGQKALLDLANALGATWDTTQWPESQE